jgi:CTP synthase (UTP-ammonia lyase)
VIKVLRRWRVSTRSDTVEKLYGNARSVDERHRHRYEVNPQYIEEFERAGMKFVGRSDDNERMEILELDEHPYFVAVQYHPEYISRPLKPSAPYLGLIWVSEEGSRQVHDNCTTRFISGGMWRAAEHTESNQQTFEQL